MLAEASLDALRGALPEAVDERVRVLVAAPPGRGGYVLYWMRIAARDHENPALDAAVAIANALDATVLVYQGVSERYPYASDRHHTFLLEGARDVARGLAARGIAHVLHVERPGQRGPFLRLLAERAALVVTEEAPMPPLAAWTERLAGHLRGRGVPLLSVDASCLVPLPLVTERFERAFAFRDAVAGLLAARVRRAWHDVEPARPARLPALPFTPVDASALDDRTIARLVGACAIDHAVGSVRELRGGSEAGYARWRAFQADGLTAYAARRNDATIDGTSRLSPWLHYGHVAPLRIAREAAALPGAGPAKFFDELAVWREVAWHFAARTPDLDVLDALPHWARKTLAAHASDARPRVTLERLERGRTGDRLWDLAQHSLRMHGELHNNVRMTWGKAIVGYTANPEEARQTLVSLNHRYALDGRDPASYGGLYWCLGLFDRPFSPELPVLGTVRPRPVAEHAARIDVDAFAARVLRPARRLGKVAVVGGGVAGLACARTLRDHGVDVTVFDKGRAPGGRLGSRRGTTLAVDLGAQYFSATDERFRRHVRSWLEDGIVAPWTGRVASVDGRGGPAVATAPAARYVGTPAMSAIGWHLSADLDVRASTRVDTVERRGDVFVLEGARGAVGTTLAPSEREGAGLQEELGEFSAVVVTLPAPQAQPLVTASAELAAACAAVPFDPCVALGLAFADDVLLGVPFDGLFVGRDGERGRMLSWVARTASKPGRPRRDAWVLHASPEWSREHLRDPEDVLERALADELGRILGTGPLRVEERVLQRWALAGTSAPLAEGALFDDALRLGVGADWTAGGGLEGAFLAGLALAGRVLGLSDLPAV